MFKYFSLLCILVFFSAAVSAEEENQSQAPVYEPITQDITGRLDKLERVLNNQGLLDMLELLESLKVEVSELRGQVEVQTHTIEQLKQKQRDLYTDVDQRLQRVETNRPIVAETNTSDINNSSVEENPADTTETVAQPEEQSAETATNQAEPVDPAKAAAEYQKAFKLLKESRYDQALKAFEGFLKDYPDSDYSDNAQYWMGEANYVMQKYEIAINEYQALLNTYPESQKVSHALLKIGYSYAELGNAADASKTLKEVKRLYPGTTAARLAEERLRKISTTESST